MPGERRARWPPFAGRVAAVARDPLFAVAERSFGVDAGQEQRRAGARIPCVPGAARAGGHPDGIARLQAGRRATAGLALPVIRRPGESQQFRVAVRAGPATTVPTVVGR